ncbi:MAG TPA: RraA family protein [Casimicrobiaceae bacterium]|nr:RraA family protein [Casimicrobiaceae bacterium]
MPEQRLSLDDLDALTTFDTPTICNALERLSPDTQGRGYTRQSFVCGFPHLKPIIGYARTATIRSAGPGDAPIAAQHALRDDYYRSIDRGPKPSVVVIQDIDENPGTGAFWGEVQSAIHVGLGARGLISNGAVRDLDQWAPGFQFLAGRITASHAYARPVGIGGEVEVFGLRVRPGDLIHADRHGAVIVPPTLVRALPEAAREVARRESRILTVARGPGCTAEKLIDVFAHLDATH